MSRRLDHVIAYAERLEDDIRRRLSDAQQAVNDTRTRIAEYASEQAAGCDVRGHASRSIPAFQYGGV